MADEPQLFFHDIEILVGVEQFQTVDDAIGADDHIDRLAGGNSAMAKLSIIIGCGQRDRLPSEIPEFKRLKKPLCFLVICITPKSLQHLREDQITYEYGLLTQKVVKGICFSGHAAIEKIDPY